MNLTPVLTHQYFDDDGEPLSGGKLYSYQAGTANPQATYTDAGGLTPNTNPIVLNAAGEAAVWLDPALSYKFVLKDANDVTRWTRDGVIGSLTVDSVGTLAIQDGAVTTPKIADGAVDFTKLASNVFEPSAQINFGIAASVVANALTFTLRTLDGGVPNALSPVRLGFRSATATSGLAVLRDLISALTITVPSGATLGGANGVEQLLYLLALDNAGTVELAVVASRQNLNEGSLISTTGISDAADSASVVYSNNARTDVPFRVLGRIKSTQATAGTWATAPSEVSIALKSWDTWGEKGALNSVVSASSGSVPIGATGGTPTDVNNMSVTITTRGRPVFLGLIDDGTNSGSRISSDGTNFRFKRDSTLLTACAMATGTVIPPSGLSFIDFPPAGTYTYKLQVTTETHTPVQYSRMIAYEL